MGRLVAVQRRLSDVAHAQVVCRKFATIATQRDGTLVDTLSQECQLCRSENNNAFNTNAQILLVLGVRCQRHHTLNGVPLHLGILVVLHALLTQKWTLPWLHALALAARILVVLYIFG